MKGLLFSRYATAYRKYEESYISVCILDIPILYVYCVGIGSKNENSSLANPKISRGLPGSWLENHPVPRRSIIFYHL